MQRPVLEGSPQDFHDASYCLFELDGLNDMSDSKDSFLLSIGMEQNNPRHDVLFDALMDDARAGRDRLYSMRSSLLPEFRDEIAVQSPYKSAQISEEAFARETRYIYENARLLTKPIYHRLSTTVPGLGFWAIRWALNRAIEEAAGASDGVRLAEAPSTPSITASDDALSTFSSIMVPESSLPASISRLSLVSGGRPSEQISFALVSKFSPDSLDAPYDAIDSAREHSLLTKFPCPPLGSAGQSHFINAACEQADSARGPGRGPVRDGVPALSYQSFGTGPEKCGGLLFGHRILAQCNGNETRRPRRCAEGNEQRRTAGFGKYRDQWTAASSPKKSKDKSWRRSLRRLATERPD